MAVHYTFDKGITLNDIRSNTDYEISKPKRARYYIIKKDDNNWLQASLSKGTIISTSKKGSSVIVDENEVPIDFFIGRGYGGLLIKDLSFIFQSKFLTDSNIDDLDEIEKEMMKRNVENFGLFVANDGTIVKSKEECDKLNDEYNNMVHQESEILDFSFEMCENDLEL